MVTVQVGILNDDGTIEYFDTVTSEEIPWILRIFKGGIILPHEK